MGMGTSLPSILPSPRMDGRHQLAGTWPPAKWAQGVRLTKGGPGAGGGLWHRHAGGIGALDAPQGRGLAGVMGMGGPGIGYPKGWCAWGWCPGVLWGGKWGAPRNGVPGDGVPRGRGSWGVAEGSARVGCPRGWGDPEDQEDGVTGDRVPPGMGYPGCGLPGEPCPLRMWGCPSSWHLLAGCPAKGSPRPHHPPAPLLPRIAARRQQWRVPCFPPEPFPLRAAAIFVVGVGGSGGVT